MKKLITILAVSLGLAASPAMAETPAGAFSGVRVEATAGVDNVINDRDVTDITYGAAAGLDTAVGSRIVVGVEAGVDNVFDRRDINAAARVGFAVNETVLVYGKAGYANYSNAFSTKLDGLRVGGGLELNVTDNLFTKVEYRYTDFERGVGKHGATVGIGIRL